MTEKIVVSQLALPVLAPSGRDAIAIVKLLREFRAYEEQGGDKFLSACFPADIIAMVHAFRGDDHSKSTMEYFESVESSPVPSSNLEEDDETVTFKGQEPFKSEVTPVKDSPSCLDGSTLSIPSTVRRNSGPPQLSSNELVKCLKRLYRPTNNTLLQLLLKRIVFTCPANEFSRFALGQHLHLFVDVVQFCGQPMLHNKVLADIVRTSIQVPSFIKYCQSEIQLKLLSYDELLQQLPRAAMQYEQLVSFTSVLQSRPAAIAAINNRESKSDGATPKKLWDKDVCIGCGHKTNPPHRRANCPYSKLPGFCRHPKIAHKPISLQGQVSAVIAVVDSCDQVSTMKGFVSNGDQEVVVTVGLDSMATHCFISPACLARIERHGPIYRVKKSKLSVEVAGSSQLLQIKEFVQISLGYRRDESLSCIDLVCGVFPIPCDIIVGWNDIIQNQMLDLFSDLAVNPLRINMENDSEEELFIDDKSLVASIAAPVPLLTVRYPHMVPNGQEEICNVVNQYSSVFNTKLGKVACKIPPMKIQLLPNSIVPPPAKLRKIADGQSHIVNHTVDGWFEDETIRPSTSNVASGVVLIQSANKEPRLCIDYRRINQITQKIAPNLPQLKVVIHRLKHKKIFGKIDLRKGYLQVALDESSKYLTAFVCEKGLFEFNRMPFGLTNAVAHFHGGVCSIFQDLIGVCLFIYIDDIIIFADSSEEFTRYCEIILSRLKDNNLIVHPDKSVFGVTSIDYLGYHISAEKVEVDRSKRIPLSTLPVPRNVKELKSFLGSVNYFRDFIPNLAIVADPLYELTSKNSKFVWGPKHQVAFDKLKQLVLDMPALHQIDYTLPIVVRSDASMHGVGATLSNIKDGKELPVAFYSHKFSKQARKWSTIDQETFAIVKSILTWDYFLMGHQFIVETDHKNIQYLLNSTSGKVGRWLLQLQQFDFVVKYIKGSQNNVADYLSRCPDGITTSDLLASKCCVLVSDSLAKHYDTIASVHNDIFGHMGITKTLKLLKQDGHNWKTINGDVTAFVHSCPICQKTRITSLDLSDIKRNVITAFQPFEEVSIDSLTSLPADVHGNTAILVIIDNFTRFVELYPVKDVTAVTAVECLLKFTGRYGFVSRIRSDRGGQFVADITKQFIDLLGAEQILTIGYSPQSNGQVERSNKEIIRHLSTLVNSRRVLQNWSTVLPIVQRIMNNIPHSTTKVSPASLVFGNSVNLSKNILSNSSTIQDICLDDYLVNLLNYQNDLLLVAQQNVAKRNDRELRGNFKNVRFRSFKVGDLVLVSNYQDETPTKFDFRYRGPYRVESVNGNVYSCLDLTTHEIHLFNVSRLKEYIHSDLNMSPVEVAALDEHEDIVLEIVNHRGSGRAKTGYDFQAKFEDGEIVWISYYEARKLEALDKYLVKHPKLQKIMNANLKGN